MSRIKPVRKSKILITVFSMLCAVILVASLLIQIKLTEATCENARLRSELDEISDENTRLIICYESSVALPELEDYAKNALGMQKPLGKDSTGKKADRQDKAVILKQYDKDEEKLVSSIKEYFGEVKCKFN